MLNRPVESYGPCNIPGNMYYLQLAYCLSFFVTRLGFDVFPVAFVVLWLPEGFLPSASACHTTMGCYCYTERIMRQGKETRRCIVWNGTKCMCTYC